MLKVVSFVKLWVLRTTSWKKSSRCQAWSIFRWREGRQWQSDGFSRFAVWMSLMMLSGKLVLSGPYGNRYKDYLNMSCCDNFSEVCIKSTASVCRTLGKKRRFFFLVIPSQKNGVKLETLVWRVKTRYLEETRNWGTAQFKSK